MYTVTIGDDGMFGAEYVVPPALSVPLGSSGSAVDVVRNEDGTYSANGEVITAETTVTAANGNVYRAVLSPEGIPVGVSHVAAMQDVMLGDLGGSVTLTQAEDMSWWYGETAVADGYVHTAENGNMYALTLDSEGMWSAMYQQVEVTVALGTQGPITLVRAEDMSWWLGSEAVDVGSEVMSESGNTYTLWYTDGVWSARFEPESMMIEGTGLVAMTREGDDMYDVGEDTLPANGKGDVTVDGAMYHVWMGDGALMGARFDAAINVATDYGTNDLNNNARLPVLSANDPDTPANELRTHLVVTGDDNTGRGTFSMEALLGSGMASDEGGRFVDEAVEEIEDVRAYVSAVLALEDPLPNLDTVLEARWTELEEALDKIFATDSGNVDNPDSAVRTTAPREEDILDEIDDILGALSSEASFVAATAKDGGGVFESQALGTGAAADAFNRITWSADATLGMTGSTRYGTAYRETSANAKSKPERNAFGAFSYSTMQQTLRTADAAAVSLTGIATYSGGTRAVSGSGKAYSGMMDLQVRFNTNTVGGVVTGLEDADGLAWQHNFANVSQIVLGDARLLRNATWNKTSSNDATVFYTRDSGILRPVSSVTNTFRGILLGRGADAGSEANGVWSVGTGDGSGYLTGGFGVVHVADAARPTPPGDDGTEAAAKLFSMATDDNATTNLTGVSIADGELKVTGRQFGWDGRDGATDPTYQALGAAGEEQKITATFDLAELAATGAKTINGPTWVEGVIATLQRERDLLATLQGLKSLDTDVAEQAAWQRVQDALQYRLFGETGMLPAEFDVLYTPGDDPDAAALDSEADAVDLIDQALDALSSNAKLEAAVRPDGTGIFSYWNTGVEDDPNTQAREDRGSYVIYDEKSDSRRWEFITGALTGTGTARTIGNFRGEREHKVIAAMGTTDYTRFGIWRREDTTSARRNDGNNASNPNQIRTHGGPGTFAYSPLDPTNVGTLANLSFPVEGSATYTGETVALQLTTVLTGTAQVNVKWDTPANVRADTTIGTMSLTISDLASANGDPLSRGGSDSTTGDEIADIVFPGNTIMVGDEGAFANKMIVGQKGTANEGNFSYSEATVNGGRYRFATGGSDVPVDGTATVQALFVGQGVDGPLGVIGTWTLNDATVGRISPTVDRADDLTAPIYGAFGAQAP